MFVSGKLLLLLFLYKQAGFSADNVVTDTFSIIFSARFPVGQNLATVWTTKTPTSLYEMDSDFPDAIHKWFNEFKYFRYGRVGHGTTGHYTQVYI